MSLFVCPKCKETYVLDDGEAGVCPKCNARLVATCEWCEKPERECHCGKDAIVVDQME